MSSILVTGGAGYIGSHVCKRLKEAGFLPVAVDDLSTGNAEAVKWGPLVEADVASRVEISFVIEKHRPAGIIHCAAWSSVVQAESDDQGYWQNNVVGTEVLAQVAGKIPIVFSSSASVYAGGLSCDEKSTLAPAGVYGWTKLESEQRLPDAMRLRYFNVAGADPEGEIGENHRPPTHIITKALLCAKTGETLMVNGDGNHTRDFVHVQDVAEANVLALKALLSGRKGEALNICTGIGHTISEVIAECERITGEKIRTRRGVERRGEARKLVGTNELAREVIGWRPQRSLESQITTAWDWIRS